MAIKKKCSCCILTCVFQSLILHFKGTGIYLERMAKMLAMNFTLLKYIFSPFLTLASCHIIVTGHNTQIKSSFFCLLCFTWKHKTKPMSFGYFRTILHKQEKMLTARWKFLLLTKIKTVFGIHFRFPNKIDKSWNIM